MAFEDAMRARRRHDLGSLTDDPAVQRVPKVVVLDPRRAARTLLAGVRDEQPDLSLTDALAEVFRLEPDLRAVFERDRLSLGEIAPADLATAIALAKEGPAGRITLGRRYTPTMKESAMEVSATERFLDLASAEQTAHPSLTRADAIGRVARREPDLYAAGVLEQTLDSQGVSLASFRFSTVGAKGVTIERVKPSSSGGQTSPAALEIIQSKVAEIMAATNLTEREALDQALLENPSLWVQYTQELKLRPNGRPAIDHQD